MDFVKMGADADMAVTLGFLTVAVTLLGGGFSLAMWIQRFANKIKSEIGAQMREMREEHTRASEAMRQTIDGFVQQFADLRVEVAKEHPTKREHELIAEQLRQLGDRVTRVEITAPVAR